MTGTHDQGAPLEIGFWARVDRSAGPDACWPMAGRPAIVGYGRYRGEYAHRLAYQLAIGPIPAGMLVCHHCDNRICANPRHLFLGTIADNNRDMTAKGRVRRGSTHPQARLRDDDIPTIRELAGVMSMAEIGARFGVSRRTIGHVLAGRTWSHIRPTGELTLGLSA